MNNTSDQEILENLANFIKNNNCFFCNEYKKMKFISLYYIYKRFNINTWSSLLNLLNLEKEYLEYKNSRKINKFDLEKEYFIIKNKLKKDKISSVDFRKYSKHDFKFIRIFYKNWNNFLKSYNFKIVSEKHKVDIGEKELIEQYINLSKKLCKKNGASIEDLKRYPNEIFSYSVYVKRFGSWIEFKKKCGFDKYFYKNKYTKEQIIKLLENKIKIYGRRLSQREITKDKELPALETILKYFKKTSLSQVWDFIEKDNKSSVIRTYSKNEIIKLLFSKYIKYNKFLSSSEIKNLKNFPSLSTIYRKFETTSLNQVWKIVLENSL